MNHIAIFLLTFFFFLKCNASSEPVKISSPDGFLTMTLTVNDSSEKKGQLNYHIDYKDKPVILNSELGITGWESEMEIETVTQQSRDTIWYPVYGERATVRDHFNAKTITLKKKNTGQKLQLIVRAYNEGIAFRYFFPEHPEHGGAYLTINSEKTSFSVSENTLAWVAYRAQHEYHLLPVKDWKDLVERPLTLQLGNGLYASLAEAEMVNYSRTKFKVNSGEENIIRCAMYGPVEEIAPVATPWRVVMVAEKPADLLANNDLILNLNPPCEIKNPEWIKPGKVIRTVSLTTEGAKKVVDFAAKRKIEYVHFDAGWYGAEHAIASDPTKSNVDPKRCPVNDLNIPEVVSYAKSKGIGIWLYVNQRALVKYLDQILPLYESWGIAGVKFGFVQVGSHHWTNWMHEAVKKCADHHLMVDIHDEYRPTGFSRTYPNLLTQEGVRGNEEFPDGNTNTTLPFTRYIAGAADATVCYFHRKELKLNLANSINARSLLNTSCHQMALSVIGYSPLQFLYWYDTPDDVQDEPELKFFDQLPTVWDDTKILDGKIGEYIIMARRKGDQWFVAAITNNDGRKIDMPLDFLKTGKTYEMTSYTDGGEKIKTRTHVKIEKQKVTSKTKYEVELQPRGGVTMIIR
ncbi:MAG TPA: alpha-glucosidase [Prolixibacteraceae bacterium]|nr:alpha-glucosidase [Prolixibacteraceae bacterium]HCU59515.1 alpha-glucosidase [Prolixibacteraceae bacterium]